MTVVQPLATIGYAPFFYFGRNQRETTAGALAGAALKSCYNLILPRDGSLLLRQGVNEWVLRPGEGSILEPGASVSWNSAATFIRLAFDIVVRDRSDLQHSVSGKVSIKSESEPQPNWHPLFGVALPLKIDERVLQHLHGAILDLASASTSSLRGSLVAHSQISTVISSYVNSLFARGGPLAFESDTLAKKLEDYLRANYASVGVIGQAAAMLGVSPEHVSRSYRKVRGETPQQFLQQYRVKQACKQMLKDSSTSFASIASQVGWSSADGMRQAFHAQFGMSPRQWVQEQRLS